MTEAYYFPVFDRENPTDPNSYVQRGRVKGMPLSWRDDISGRTQEAVMAYLMGISTPEQMEIVIAYVQHHIHAPMWLEQWPWLSDDSERQASVRELRELSLTLKTAEDVHAYNDKALGAMIDPF